MKKTSIIVKALIVLAVLLAGLFCWVIWDELQSTTKRAYKEIPVERVLAAEPEEGTAVPAQGEPKEVVSVTQAEPGAVEPGGESAAESSPVTLLFAGDILLSDHVLRAYDKAGGIGGVLDEGIQSQIRQADIFMANQEFPFSDRGTAADDKQFTFRLPPSRVSLMQEMGIDLVTLANNHILDFGTEALLDSCTTLEQAGIPYVGAGENLDRARRLEILEAGEKTIGFLGLSRVYMDAAWAAADSRPGVFSTYDSAMPVEEIKKAGERCDYLVVYVHWGVEREEEPKDYQRALAQVYIDAGADLVVGSHPHVLQGLEYYKGKPIIYSLGNFVFGSSIPQTALLKVTLQEEPQLALIPCTSAGGYTQMVTDPAKQQTFYQRMTELSFGVSIGEDGEISVP